MAPDRVGRLKTCQSLDRCAERAARRALACKIGRQDLKARATGLKRIQDPQKPSATARQPIEPLDDQEIARTDEFENGVQNGAVRTGRFMANDLTTGGFQQGRILARGFVNLANITNPEHTHPLVPDLRVLDGKVPKTSAAAKTGGG
jgi:hypothetical protein